MEPVAKAKLYQSPRQKAREGDWVCIYCRNLNYAFRSICNRCKLQTKQRNLAEAAQLNFPYLLQRTEEWHLRLTTQNEDPMEDDHFPKALFVTAPKTYLGVTPFPKQPQWSDELSKDLTLRQRNPNQAKTKSKNRLDSFEKQNLRWLNKIIEE